MILVIDNYDSFTFNLVQFMGELGARMRVFRNDTVSLEEIEQLAPEKIVISPGPCTPKEAGISCTVIEHFGNRIPILGVCLGHQSIAQVYGGEVVQGQISHDRLKPEQQTRRKALDDGRKEWRKAWRYFAFREAWPDENLKDEISLPYSVMFLTRKTQAPETTTQPNDSAQ